MMKKVLFILLIECIACTLISCKDNKKSDNIIAQKSIVIKAHKTLKTGDYSQNKKISWVGTEYNISVTLTADTSLPVVKYGSQKYYDNKIQLRVLRKDGTELFNRVFTKSDFTSYVSADFKDSSALLCIVYDHADNSSLYFTASVGSPDKTSDKYTPLKLRLTKTGTISISKDTPVSTDNDTQTDGIKTSTNSDI